MIVSRGSWGSRAEEWRRGLVWMLAAWGVLVLAWQTVGGAVEPEKSETAYIVSLWYGIFRNAEYRGGPPLVEVGSHVEPGTIVGIIEPLMMSGADGVVAIPAGYKGTITATLVRNGEIVMIGQRLFEVRLDPPETEDLPSHDSAPR
ncbi:MAG: hypothetical protein GTO03_11645 [Planctomycetales bacterium]|nr:hypothetical protein [Planctomycetales bacterium]